MDKVQKNKELIERYPFLMPRNLWTNEISENYDFSHTYLDDMPDGWRNAFGEEMCEEILEELISTNTLETYRIIQVKEKFGSLRWYDEGGSDRIFWEIVPKYAARSMQTCIHCGKPATKKSTGWISPWCDACAEGVADERFVEISPAIDHAREEYDEIHEN